MKLELIKKNNLYYINNDGAETLIPKDPNDDNISYTNKAFACFDRLVNLHKEHTYDNTVEIIKTVNI